MSSRENNVFSLLPIGLLAALLEVSPNTNEGLLPVTATFQEQSKNGNPVKNYSRRYKQGEWVKVGGFADSKYFYGQVQLVGKRKVVGYLYFPTPLPKREPIDPSAPDFPRQKQDPIRQEQVYVYGELVRPGEFRVFDKQGTLYRLLVVEGNR